MLTTFTFTDSLEEVRESQRNVQAALVALQKSNHFRSVVTIVLAIGNYLNGSTKKGGAHGFSLKDLEKLLQVKTTDNKGTLMHYLANFLTSKKPELCAFLTELKPVQDSSTIDVGELLKDFNGQKKKLNELKKEADISKGLGGDNFIRRMKLFISDAESLLNATEKEFNQLWTDLKVQIIGWGEKEPKQGASPDPASTFFTQISKFCKAYKRAADENQRKKEMAAKKARQEAEKAAKRAKRLAKRESAAPAAKEDIFDAFDQKMKGGNANDIISKWMGMLLLLLLFFLNLIFLLFSFFVNTVLFVCALPTGEFKNRHKKKAVRKPRGDPMAGMLGELAGKLKKRAM